MKYTIISPRVGIPGDTYEAVDGVNVDALVAGGFIEQSTVKAPKGAKTKTDTNEE
jgi:hypothetical protein